MPSPLYSPFESESSTRLVILQPGIGDDQISACLEQVDLRAKPSYEAVSYVWANNTDEQAIRLNGHEIHIRKNLHDFLLKLRQPTSSRAIWVDAISICQEDLDEKARQVQMIGQIFSGAQRVLVWLGEQADSSNELFEYCSTRVIPLAQPHEFLSYIHPVSKRPEPTRNSEPSSNCQPSPNRELLRDAWARLMLRPYFTRTWIIQECTVARSIIVHCGNCSVNWDRLFGEHCEWGFPASLHKRGSSPGAEEPDHLRLQHASRVISNLQRLRY